MTQFLRPTKFDKFDTLEGYGFADLGRAGLPNFAASIGMFGLISVISNSDRLFVQVAVHLTLH